MYVYMYVCTCAYACIRMLYVCICAKCQCVYVCMHAVCMYVCVYVFVRMYVCCACVCMYVCIWTFIKRILGPSKSLLNQDTAMATIYYGVGDVQPDHPVLHSE